jgi:N-acetyl-anhydromuramyl-L-alanine amidase AmpD
MSDTDAFTSDLENVTVHDSGVVELPSGARITKRPIWDHCIGGAARLGWKAAADWLASRGMREATAAEYDELHMLPATMHIAPVTMPLAEQLASAGIRLTSNTKQAREAYAAAVNAFRNPRMRSRAWCELHDATVAQLLLDAGYSGTEPVANDGKHWAAPSGTLVGWYTVDGKLKRIQNPRSEKAPNFPPHGPEYTDYASTFHGVMLEDDDDQLEGDDEVDATPPPASTDPSPYTDDDPPSPSKRGDSVSKVRAWQLHLVDYFDELGKQALPRYGVDGDHGDETEDWTKRWMALEAIDDGTVVVELGTSPPPPSAPLPSFDLDSMPFIEARNYTRVDERQVDLVVVHDMEYPERLDAAEAVANWFGGPNAPRASAHVCVDADSAVRCARWSDVCWHAPGANHNGIGIEHAGYARQSLEEWLDDYSRAMLELSARITAALCDRFDIPVELVDVEGLKAGRRGITSHRWVSLAFRKSTHTDPGPDFPWDWYLQLVKAASTS